MLMFDQGQLKVKFKIKHCIKLMKRKTLRKNSLHEKTAASVLFKLFISSNKWCHTTDALLFCILSPLFIFWIPGGIYK